MAAILDTKNKTNNRLTALEKEKIKIWNKIKSIEDSIASKETTPEKEAWQSARKTTEYKNKSEAVKNAAVSYLEEIKPAVTKIKEALSTVQALNNEVATKSNVIDSSSKTITEKYNRIIEISDEIESIYEGYDSLHEKVDAVDEIAEKGSEAAAKSNALFTTILTRKKEIDKIYFEVAGYTETNDETGESTTVEGLRDQLEGTYDEIQSKILKAEDSLNELDQTTVENYGNFLKESTGKFDSLESNWNKRYIKIKNEIEGLLPNALTAGLSHAYSEKKSDEESMHSGLLKKFNKSIIGSVAISTIPFIASIFSIYNGKTFEQSLLDIPRLVLSIIPLYIPVLWVAYSTNKKINLSKRLIEEYTHKEVLSKTFEGLSKQIENIDDTNISSDLKTKLLYNILEVSSENPGKLITDYNKSDHPLMDALDKSVKLTNAVNKLSNVPGVGKISEILDLKSKKILDSEKMKVEAGLDKFSNEEKEELVNEEKKLTT